MSERRLTLIVGVTPGARLEKTLEDASRLARLLNLAWVEFRFNDMGMTVYQTGRALEFQNNVLRAQWDRQTDGEWTREGRGHV